MYAPPPEGLHERLVWRVDDTPEVLSRRLAEHRHSCADIVRTFEGARVPFRRIDTARSELDCFREVATFLEGVALGKVSQYRDYLVRQRRLEDAAEGWGEEGARVLYRGYGGRRLQEGSLPTSADTWQEAMAALAGGVSDFREGDVEALCEPGEEEGTCIVRYYEEAGTRESDVVGTLLAAVRRCNEYVPGAFVPVVAAGEQVGWVDAATREALAPQLAAGYACRYVDIALRKPTLTLTLSLSLRYACRYVDWPPTSSDSSVSGSSPEGIALELAPVATSSSERTEVVATLVEELVADGHIPAAKVSETDCICSQLFAAVCSCLHLSAAASVCTCLHLMTFLEPLTATDGHKWTLNASNASNETGHSKYGQCLLSPLATHLQ